MTSFRSDSITRKKEFGTDAPRKNIAFALSLRVFQAPQMKDFCCIFAVRRYSICLENFYMFYQATYNDFLFILITKGV